MNNILRCVDFQGMVFSAFFFFFFFFFFFIFFRIVYLVLGNFEKKLALCEAEMGPGSEFWHPLSKISRCLQIRNHSGKLYQSTEKSEKHFSCEAD